MTSKRRIAAVLVILCLGVQALIRLAHRDAPELPVSAVDWSSSAKGIVPPGNVDCQTEATEQLVKRDETLEQQQEAASSLEAPAPSTLSESLATTSESTPGDQNDQPPRPLEEWMTPMEVAFRQPVRMGDSAPSRPAPQDADEWKVVDQQQTVPTQVDATPVEIASDELVPELVQNEAESVESASSDTVALPDLLSPEEMPPLPPISANEVAVTVSSEVTPSPFPIEAPEVAPPSVTKDIVSVPELPATDSVVPPPLPPSAKHSDSPVAIAESEARWSAVKTENGAGSDSSDANWTPLPVPAPVAEATPEPILVSPAAAPAEKQPTIAAPLALEQDVQVSKAPLAQANQTFVPPPPPAPAKDLTQIEKLKQRTDSRMKVLNKSVTTIAIAPEPKADSLPLSLAHLEAQDEPLIVVTSAGWMEPRPNRYPVPFFHQPLYFENPALERCGRGFGVFQPFVSGGLFLGETISAPFHIGAVCPVRLVESLGDCPTGCVMPCVPVYRYSDWQVMRGTLAETAAVVGFVILLM